MLCNKDFILLIRVFEKVVEKIKFSVCRPIAEVGPAV